MSASATSQEARAWLTELRLRRKDLVTLLSGQHYDNPFKVDLHANGRARDSVADACRVAEALMVLRIAELEAEERDIQEQTC